MGGEDPRSSDAQATAPLAPTHRPAPGPGSTCSCSRLMSEDPIGPLLGQVSSLDQSAMVGGRGPVVQHESGQSRREENLWAGQPRTGGSSCFLGGWQALRLKCPSVVCPGVLGPTRRPCDGREPDTLQVKRREEMWGRAPVERTLTTGGWTSGQEAGQT